MEYFTPAAENELQLDLDTLSARKTFKKQLKFLRSLKHIKVQSIRRYTSKSGNVHILLRLTRPMPIMQRIALQALLGSDVRREMFNWARARNKAPHPILFVHPRPRS